MIRCVGCDDEATRILAGCSLCEACYELVRTALPEWAIGRSDLVLEALKAAHELLETAAPS